MGGGHTYIHTHTSLPPIIILDEKLIFKILACLVGSGFLGSEMNLYSQFRIAD